MSCENCHQPTNERHADRILCAACWSHLGIDKEQP